MKQDLEMTILNNLGLVLLASGSGIYLTIKIAKSISKSISDAEEIRRDNKEKAREAAFEENCLRRFPALRERKSAVSFVGSCNKLKNFGVKNFDAKREVENILAFLVKYNCMSFKNGQIIFSSNAKSVEMHKEGYYSHGESWEIMGEGTGRKPGISSWVPPKDYQVVTTSVQI